MWRRAVATAATAIVTCLPLAATVTVPVGFHEIVDKASLIVRGRVTDVRAAETAERRVDSFATVAVESTLKGSASEFVYVRVPGGELGRYRVLVVGAPALRVNSRAMFFLTRDRAGMWSPVGLSAGVLAIEHLATTGAAVIRPPLVPGRTTSSGRVVRGDVRRKPLPIEEFESLVRLIVAGRLAVAAPAR